jgi:hypothetical protein
MEQAKTKKRKKKRIKKNDRRDLDTLETFFPFRIDKIQYTLKIQKNQLHLH